MTVPRHVYVMAGEPSGDFLGGALIRALKEKDPTLKIAGVGGVHMSASGLTSLFPYEDLAVMGLAEVLPRLPLLLRRIRQTADHIIATCPDIVVSIDSPDFCLRVIKSVRARMDAASLPKFIHYVAPTVWAWREGRAEKLAKQVDGLICLFDFEPQYFERYGLRSIAVGHPMVEGDAMKADPVAFRAQHNIAGNEPVIGLLCGSRRGEIARTAPVLREAARIMAARMDGQVHIVSPTLPHVRDMVSSILTDMPCKVHVLDDPSQKYHAFSAMNIALATSGTVGLELAAMQIPHVIGYKTSPVTAAIVRRMIRVKYAHLANIMENHAVVPEFLQENCVADKIAYAALDLYNDPYAQKEAFSDIAQRLGFNQEETPSQKAAAFVLSL